MDKDEIERFQAQIKVNLDRLDQTVQHFIDFAKTSGETCNTTKSNPDQADRWAALRAKNEELGRLLDDLLSKEQERQNGS